MKKISKNYDWKIMTRIIHLQICCFALSHEEWNIIFPFKLNHEMHEMHEKILNCFFIVS